MKKIEARIVADSIDRRGNRITSFILTYPRFIHSELMTHRMFSRNAASSRAIPFEKMVKEIEENPFIPVAWQKHHKGMQGVEYITDSKIIEAKVSIWVQASKDAIENAWKLYSNNKTYCNPMESGLRQDFEWIEQPDTEVTKQLCNRLLEPFQWMTTLVTATEFENFFSLRCPQYFYEPENIYFKSKKDFGTKYHECFGSDEFINWDFVKWQSINTSQAEIHIQALAESMWDAKNESTPKELSSGEWHIPFGDKIYSEDTIEDVLRKQPGVQWVSAEGHDEELDKLAIKIATARCARLSYMTFDGEIDYEKDIKLHDRLLESKHASPFEHCARTMSEDEYNYSAKGMCKFDEEDGSAYMPEGTEGWCNNFRGFIPYRYLIEND